MTISARALHNTAHQLDVIANDLDIVREHYARERARVDGYPGGATDAGPTRRHSGELTTTEVIAAQLEHLRHNLEYIEASLNVIVVTTAHVARACRGAVGTRITTPPRCDGRGLEGFDEWGIPDCDMPATKAGLCGNHYMACYRWRRDHGRPVLAIERGDS